MKLTINNIIVSIREQDHTKAILNSIQKLGIEKENVLNVEYEKRSIDSRNRSEIKFLYNLSVEVKDGTRIPESQNILPYKEKIEPKRDGCFDKNLKVAVIGTGPAGLFASYKLCLLGYSPMIFERGESIDDRDKSVRNFMSTGILNPNSNIQFGEGGAGTYSDGKLNTRIRSGYINEIFKTLVECGAQKEIMWDYKPHIGTDILKVVTKNLRKKIEDLGGKFYFSSDMTDIKIQENKITAIEIKNLKNSHTETIEVDKLILAIGHSSRDTYKLLDEKKIAMKNKPFAVGVRIEHPRNYIDKLMFGACAGEKVLGAATYSMAYNNKAEDRGVFSFCMCPGGEIVNASSEVGGSLVNGMSYSTRNGKFSNSALVVAVKENEFGDELFSGMNFQRKLERETFKICGGHGAIFQNVKDFLSDTKSKNINETSFKMSLVAENINNFLPKFIIENLKLGLSHFNKIHSGFGSDKGNLIGFETRTSAPVIILRDENGESISTKNIFPIGEGSGYAGGIISAAVDGMKIVDSSFSKEVKL